MRIIQVGPDDSRPGGIRTVMLSLEQSALREQFGLDIIPTSSKTHRISTFIHGFRRIRKKILSGECNCVHIHMSENASVYRSVLLIRWIKAHSDAHVIVQSHGGSVQRFFKQCPHHIKKHIVANLGAADLFVVLTPGWKKWWSGLLPDMRYSVVPNGVDLPVLSNRLSAMREGNEGQSKTVLFVGHIDERKGAYLLVSVVPDILSRHPSTHFVFAGDGEIEECKSFASELGVSGSCEFVGWADKQKKEHLFRNASLLVLPSKEESFGIVLLEAMSYCLPVICSDGGFMHEIVDDGLDGIVFATGSREELSRSISLLLQDVSLSRAMGESGREKVEKYYSLPSVIERWGEIYSEAFN